MQRPYQQRGNQFCPVRSAKLPKWTRALVLAVRAPEAGERALWAAVLLDALSVCDQFGHKPTHCNEGRYYREWLSTRAWASTVDATETVPSLEGICLIFNLTPVTIRAELLTRTEASPFYQRLMNPPQKTRRRRKTLSRAHYRALFVEAHVA